MDNFRGKRAIEKYTGKINSSPSEVFPLLCPVREYDWLEGWACSMTYSDSGIVENNCIFKSEFVTGMDATWVAIKRDEENHIFQYIIFFADLAVARMDISLVDNNDGTTTMHYVRTMTSLSEDGNQMLDHTVGEPFRQIMDWVYGSLNHYLQTGEMLKTG